MTPTSRCAALVALSAAAGAAVWFAPQPASGQGRNVRIVLDSSGSMAGKVGGPVKIERVVTSGKYFAVASEQELRGARTKTSAPPPPPECRKQAAMWRSIAHPGLGEMLNAGQGWNGMPKRKFCLGFIPFFGWPGYLQVVSAIDAAHCQTNDWPH